MPKTNKICCEFCGKPIPQERLEILPDTTTCVKCSQTTPYSQEEVIGMNENDDEANRLNMEDFEDSDSSFMPSSESSW